LANTISNLLNGGPVVFYYDTHRTFGLTFGLVASPLIWFLGPTSLAFNLPATLFYSLYLWTTYLIARILIPRTAYLVFIMLIFTPEHISLSSTTQTSRLPTHIPNDDVTTNMNDPASNPQYVHNAAQQKTTMKHSSTSRLPTHKKKITQRNAIPNEVSNNKYRLFS
jgi:hypothetical protein